MNRKRRPLIAPIVLLVFLTAYRLTWNHFGAASQKAILLSQSYLLEEVWFTLIFLGVAWLISRIIGVYFWQWFIERRIQGKIPRLLKTIVSTIIFLIALFLIVSIVFKKSISGLLATTGVLGIILGFALRGTIESAFTGVTMSIDPIFRIGDLVLLRDLLDGPAEVVEMSWRYTCFRDGNDNLIFVPNNLTNNAIVINFSRPQTLSAFTLPISIYILTIPIERVMRILEAALKSVDSISETPESKVRIKNIEDGFVEFEMKYWFDIATTSLKKTKNELYLSLIHHLSMVGLNMESTSWRYRDQFVQITNEGIAPEKIRDQLAQTPFPLLSSEETLKKIELFSTLSDAEYLALAKQLNMQTIKQGSVIVNQEDNGDSMFIVVEGLARVLIQVKETKAWVPTAKLIPGSYFGEMSLLLGEPRSARVVAVTDCYLYEITKEAMQHMFSSHPNLVAVLSEKIAERQIQNLKTQQALLDKEAADQKKNYTKKFIDLIKKWFGYS